MMTTNSRQGAKAQSFDPRAKRIQQRAYCTCGMVFIRWRTAKRGFGSFRDTCCCGLKLNFEKPRKLYLRPEHKQAANARAHAKARTRIRRPFYAAPEPYAVSVSPVIWWGSP